MAANSKDIEFGAGARTCAGYLSLPAGGQGPGLVVLQEWWGLVDHIKDVADRFAEAGFVALAPDLYHGESTKDPDEAGRKMMALDLDRAAADVAGAAEHLLGLNEVAPKKVAVLGFCMGGQLAVNATCSHPDKIQACVDFYGIHPNAKPDLSRLTAPILAHFGKTDGFVDQAAAKGLVTAVRAAGGSIDEHFYEAGHAFFNDSRPDAYVAAPAKAAWERTLTFLRSHLAG